MPLLAVQANRDRADHGGGLYRKRQRMIEPVFADTKFKVTFDRYGHLMPGSEAEVAG